ncbi:MAG: TlpA family protein disulfide reductase [Rickettsiales bacterium]|nr:TlpA family protein disulfide reductase [Rickettsiales bacterium]
MRYKLSIFIILTCSFIVAFYYNQNHQTVLERTNFNELNQELTTLKLKTLEGTEIDFKDINSRIILLNFWASWCAPCLKEFPSMLKLLNEANGDIAIIAISIDSKTSDAIKFLEKINYKEAIYPNSYFVIDSEQQIAKDKFGVFLVPETLIIRNGEITQKIQGGIEWNKETVNL